MKDIWKFWVQGRTRFTQGLATTILLIATALLLMAGSAKAAQPMTQLEYIQWLVQATGESGQFKATAAATDFQQWAQAKGLAPAGGWNLTAPLTRPVLAQTLAQLLNLAASDKDAGDYVRVLLREGINLPTADQIDRGTVVSLLSSSFVPVSNNAGSPVRRPNNGFGNGDQPPPPHNPNGNPHNTPPGNSGDVPPSH